MKIVKEYPPNYEAICSRFPNVRKSKGVVFTYGDTLYNPSGANIPDHLIVHEGTHVAQQRVIGIDEWWKRYLEDRNFRAWNEAVAYRNQWKFIVDNYNRADRRKLLSCIVKDFSSMYDIDIVREQAKSIITEESAYLFYLSYLRKQ